MTGIAAWRLTVPTIERLLRAEGEAAA